MLTRIGPPPPAGDVVDALLDCHERIRSFTALAARLAAAVDLQPDAIRDAASRVHRYFSVALPLHARDEEESLLPRLRGLDPALDRELAAMLDEHGAHGAPTDRVVHACAVLKDRPGELAALAPELAAAARALEEHFAVHLAREEQRVFPAIRARLDRETQEAVQAEMRARRG